MTTAAVDTFRRFVAVLADAMDDHDADGEALASRLHLSRFHADRLVRAASGESPAALRRRVLLERAAYRLATSDHDVLRVAVEAGYSSNEAFTRAFSRAFGRPPSRWRAQPASYRLEAPSRCTSSRPAACGCRPTGRSPPWSCSPAWSSTTSGWSASSSTGAPASPRSSWTRPSRSRWTESTTTPPSGHCWPGWSARWRCGTRRCTTVRTTSTRNAPGTSARSGRA